MRMKASSKPLSEHQKINRDFNNIKRQLNYVIESSWDIKSKRHCYAIQRAVSLICEIASLGSAFNQSFKETHSSVPWKALKELRTAVVHQSYWLDDSPFIQEAIEDLPKLLPIIEAFLSGSTVPEWSSLSDEKFMQRTIDFM